MIARERGRSGCAIENLKAAEVQEQAGDRSIAYGIRNTATD